MPWQTYFNCKLYRGESHSSPRVPKVKRQKHVQFYKLTSIVKQAIGRVVAHFHIEPEALTSSRTVDLDYTHKGTYEYAHTGPHHGTLETQHTHITYRSVTIRWRGREGEEYPFFCVCVCVSYLILPGNRPPTLFLARACCFPTNTLHFSCSLMGGELSPFLPPPSTSANNGGLDPSYIPLSVAARWPRAVLLSE